MWDRLNTQCMRRLHFSTGTVLFVACGAYETQHTLLSGAHMSHQTHVQTTTNPATNEDEEETTSDP